MIDKIEITKRSKVRRSKLYYIRIKALKQISKRMKMLFVNINDSVKPEDLDMPEVADEELTPEEIKLAEEMSSDEVSEALAEHAEEAEVSEQPSEEKKEEN